MRPVCFHQPCKIDPINRARSLDISEKHRRLFGALCDDSERVIGLCTLSASMPAAETNPNQSYPSKNINSIGVEPINWGANR